MRADVSSSSLLKTSVGARVYYDTMRTMCWKGCFDDVTMFLSKFPWRHVELTPPSPVFSVCVGDNALLTQMPTWAYCTGIININTCITALVFPWWAKSLQKPLCVSYSLMTLAHLPCQAFEESLQSRLLQAALKTPTAGSKYPAAFKIGQC